MRVSKDGKSGPTFSLTTITGGSAGGGNTGPSGHSLQSLGSNGQVAWASNIASVTANGSNYLVGPHVNFISGTGITLSTSSNGMTITATGAAATGDFVTTSAGGGEVLSTVASSGATETIDLANGNVHDVTLTANCTFTFASVSSGRARSFTLLLRQDGTGSRLATWPGSVVWAGGSAPTLSTPASSVDVLTFFTLDGGTVWYGFATGGGSAALDYAEAADIAAVGTAAAAGTSAEVPRADHVHALAGSTLSTLGARGELLITDTPAGSPLVFADVLQNEAQDELLYADM